MYCHSELVIAVPAYNEENYIGEALQSIKDQSHANFLVVVGDNCSSDRTREIVSTFCESDRRFILHKHERNIGAARNFEFLYRYTGSPYFMWMGAHDRITWNFLEKHISFLNGNGDYSLSYSSIRSIDIVGSGIGITSGSGLDEVADASPLLRYYKSINKLGECTAINHPFRRTALSNFRFPVVASPDHIMLSRILFFGKINRFCTPLYERRYFDQSETKYMERLTGVSTKRLIKKRLWRTKLEYLRDFVSLPGHRFKKVGYFSIVLFAIDKEFGLGVFRIRRLLGNILRRVRLRIG